MIFLPIPNVIRNSRIRFWSRNILFQERIWSNYMQKRRKSDQNSSCRSSRNINPSHTLLNPTNIRKDEQGEKTMTTSTPCYSLIKHTIGNKNWKDDLTREGHYLCPEDLLLDEERGNTRPVRSCTRFNWNRGSRINFVHRWNRVLGSLSLLAVSEIQRCLF